MWVWSTQTHYSQDRGRGCWRQWLMRCSFVLPRDHIWSQWRFVLITPSIFCGCWRFSAALKRYEKILHFFFLSGCLFSQDVVGNCIKLLTWPMQNIFSPLSFPDRKFPLRTQLCQQQAAICSKVRTLSKSFLASACSSPRPCIKPDDCGYQIGVVMRS